MTTEQYDKEDLEREAKQQKVKAIYDDDIKTAFQKAHGISKDDIIREKDIIIRYLEKRIEELT